MIAQIEQTSCLYCGQPVMQAAKRGPRLRLYCNDVHRQLAYRKRQHEQAQEAVRRRWAEYLPSTKELLEEIMQAHGEALADRIVDAISDEREKHVQELAATFQAQIATLQERLYIERRIS